MGPSDVNRCLYVWCISVDLFNRNAALARGQKVTNRVNKQWDERLQHEYKKLTIRPAKTIMYYY